MAKDTTLNFFGKRREELGLTRFEMANRIGDVTPSALQFWERDEIAPPLSRVPGIARGYDLDEEAVEREIVSIGRRLRRPQPKAPALSKIGAKS